MNESKKELIIKSFETMNLSMLDVLLDDFKTYQDTTKEIFLKKIEEIFTKLKAKGDSRLNSYKGFCKSDDCINKGCKGYSLIGNKSKFNLDLIFKESDDDIDDIYNCNDFETYDKSLEKTFNMSIMIMEDEEADFIPDIDYLIRVQKYEFAYEELYKYKDKIISKDIYLSWLERHNSLYESFPFPPFVDDSKQMRFYWFYSSLKDLKDYLQSDESTKNAVIEFENIKDGNETQLLTWLVKYEKTGHNLTFFRYNDIDFENPESTPFFIVENLNICTTDFKFIIKFKSLFEERYQLMLEKYISFTEEEKNKIIEQNNEIVKYINSLSYHLEKRGIKLDL